MTNIMVSYSRKDSVVARKLIECFKTMDLDVWVDWEDIPPAVGWLDQILRGIEESDAFIFLISPDSIVSEVCNVEIMHAAKNNKRIIPIVVRDVNTKSVTPIIRDLNWIFGREQDDFDGCLEKIKIAIELDIEWVGEHRRLQVRALEWDRKKDLSLLLRGRDLRNAHQMVVLAVQKEPKPTDLQRLYLEHSRRTERNRFLLGMATMLTLVVLAALSYIAFDRAIEARRQADRADQQRATAVYNENLARQQEFIANANANKALVAEAAARDSEKNAQAQRSTALAQIYQSKPGELYTSTLLAIDSMRRFPSLEAAEILRKNISLLPIPVEQMAQEGRINSLEFSPDGQTFVTASADGTACVWNVKDGKMLFPCVAMSGPVNDAAFSPQGDFIVLGDTLGLVMIVDAKTGEVQNRFLMLQGQEQLMRTLTENETVPEIGSVDTAAVTDVSFNDRRQLLAIARDDGNIVMINLRDRKFGFRLKTSGSLRTSAFSPDGQWFAAGTNEGTVTLWNLGSDSDQSDQILRAPGHRGAVITLEFSPDSRKLVSGGANGVAIVSRTATATELFRIQNEDRVEDIAFSPDNSWFVTVSSDRRIRVWDATTSKERLRLLQDNPLSKVKVSANGRWLATIGSDRTVRLWNVATGSEILQIPLTRNGSVLAFSPDENHLLSGDEGGEIAIWDISGMVASESYLPFTGLTGDVHFSPSGDWLAASDDGRVWRLDVEQFSSLELRPQDKPIFESKSKVRTLLVSPDSKWIGILVESGDIILYSVGSEDTRTMKFADPALNFVFSADGLQLITAGMDGKVQVWDLASDTLLKILYETEGSVTSLAISHTLLAVGLTDQIVVLDVENGDVLDEIEAPGDHPLMAFNLDVSLLVSANSSRQITVWKRADNQFEQLKQVNSVQIFSMTFNPEGDQLLVGAQDIAYVFDPLTMQEIARIPHKDAVQGLSFSADGNMLATASYKLIQLWGSQAIPIIREDDLIEAACARVIQNFDETQWSAFFADELYKPLCENLEAAATR